ncbi:MAG: geranylgeranylglycerol-phosphate geranylgeranyltransferase [Flavobacteriales bacterium]|nr:geranylgeranylglycerol-phosphate geranylgeranyltransferase [Flavobacteriales bacterium]
MNPVVAFLKLVRWPNLVIVILVLTLTRYCLIHPMTEAILVRKVSLPFSTLDFMLLVVATVLMAAAGNIINDYFDVRIDRINKPHKIIVGKYIKRRVAMLLHTIFTGLGVLIGLWLCYKTGLWKFSIIFLFTSASLWFYATTFKHTTLIGNLIIALLAFLVPFTEGLFEISLLNKTLATEIIDFPKAFNSIAYWVIGYGCFAFIYTFSREITKDIEDIEGDKKYNSKSIPVAWGINWAKSIIVVLYLGAISLLALIYVLFLKDYYTLIYLIVGIIIPTIGLIFYTIKAKQKEQFHKASNWNKVITLIGVLFAILVGYIFESLA